MKGLFLLSRWMPQSPTLKNFTRFVILLIDRFFYAIFNHSVCSSFYLSICLCRFVSRPPFGFGISLPFGAWSITKRCVVYIDFVIPIQCDLWPCGQINRVFICLLVWPIIFSHLYVLCHSHIWYHFWHMSVGCCVTFFFMISVWP